MQKLKATLYKIGYPIMRIYWFFRRPTTQGVRCVIFYEGKVLSIQHTYGSSLHTTVGGGVEKKETPQATAIRETYEEVGLTLIDIIPVSQILYTKEYKHDTIHVFTATATSNALQADHSEIKTAAWYDLDNLPTNTSPLFLTFLEQAILQKNT